MNSEQFREEAHKMVDWMADYLEHVEEYPVRAQVKPGETMKQIPKEAPVQAEDFEDIFKDFKEIIMPGMTHWESPKFMAYFPANKSYPSILGEMLTATLGAQCMSWITSPAATELEEAVMGWLGSMTGIPDHFSGVIQDTASTATLTALLMAREKVSGFEINEQGFEAGNEYTVYCSSETHSSIEKDVKIAGFGKNNLRKIAYDDSYAMRPEKLEEAIRKDLENGLKPACVIATIGTTGSTAIDPLREIADICNRYEVFLHVDAAFAGTAMILPELRWMIEGIERVDSYVFNPHKWMFTNFDCSAFYVKDEAQLVKTFEITPEYLKTPEDERVKNYRDWGIPLGRRFRALKLWFVIRNFGIEGLRNKIRKHLELAEKQKAVIEQDPDFELLAPVPLNTICFRYHPSYIDDDNKLNELNSILLEHINDSGKLFITHTKLNGRFTLRMVIGNTNVEQRHVDEAWSLIKEKSSKLI
ncbi:aminotransferase class I/II-fold pyridoxal phosphate-dependent enzyme [Balneolaceae bacterium YR4-1]|uniref:Aminotransferase class I/II-fold pyridoxal phosphate-dependent enzyme n=1 Tax=Halalkalibaculum roseum TaxID=2709311 RepID=A0A6M1SW09_9BACT|nr:aminotransferase class I/II-fold pyridoxal phosphate-dependent enzyme [Halalkalibaculum roseum]NGP76286.1 aminotransferase class I/II-fold pyridoxal phosphate-dependent enzyme [Halalkalibaculum roseum]